MYFLFLLSCFAKFLEVLKSMMSLVFCFSNYFWRFLVLVLGFLSSDIVGSGFVFSDDLSKSLYISNHKIDQI